MRAAAALACAALASGAAASEPVPPGAAAPAGREVATAVDPAASAESPALERAWLAPAASLEERALRTRRAALEAGLWSLDPVAAALLASPGDPVERARAAVRVAPELPVARMALAASLWRRGDAPLETLTEAVAALASLFRHTEATLWSAGSALAVLAAGLVLGGLACIACAAALAFPRAAHDVGDAIVGGAPPFARAALVASALLVPLLLGEGPFGIALALLALGVAWGTRRERLALAAAALAVWAGAFPVATLAGRCLEALGRDPVAAAALAVDAGRAGPAELARLEVAADSDALAARALARRARLTGRLGEADRRYQDLLAAGEADAALANDAANLRLRLGHVQPALELYQRALADGASAPVLFNLSQAYARAFEVELLTGVLERAQALDGALLGELAEMQQGVEAGSFVVDLPLPRRALWARLARASDGRALAADARAALAPGRLGASPGAALVALFATTSLAAVLSRRLRRSHACERCGRRNCPRCDGARRGEPLCAACQRLFLHPEQTQRELRVARIAALEERRRRLDRLETLAGLLVPGAAGLLASRPLRALVACVLLATAGAALAWRRGVVPDPGVAGAAGPALLLVVATLSGVAYAALATASVAARRSRAS